MSDTPEGRKAQLRSAFNLLVPDYDVAGPGCFAHFGRRLVEVADIAPNQRVLDVATGRGAVLVPAAERVGTAGEAVGIDLADGMARAAAAAATRRGLHVRVYVMDAERLDFPDATFDRVLCGFGLMVFPNLDGALGEFRRVLKPGGRLAVSTWRRSQAEDLAAVLNALGLGQQTEPSWITEPGELAQILTRAGFSDVRVLADSETFRYADLEQYWQNARGTGLRRRLDTLDDAQRERAFAALAERLQPHRRTDGIHLQATALLAMAGRE